VNVHHERNLSFQCDRDEILYSRGDNLAPVSEIIDIYGYEDQTIISHVLYMNFDTSSACILTSEAEQEV
jgi:hypothetical protein